jgi:hypothetical protein
LVVVVKKNAKIFEDWHCKGESRGIKGTWKWVLGRRKKREPGLLEAD